MGASYRLLSTAGILLAGFSFACKPKNSSAIKTLENFAYQQKLRSNVCSGPPSERPALASLLAKIKIDGGTPSQQNLVRETLTAVPETILEFAVQTRTIIHIVANAKAACAKRVGNDLAMAPLYESARSCMASGFRGKTAVTKVGLARTMPPLDLYVDADDGAIKHYLLRQFGNITFALYNHTKAEHGDDGEVGIRTPNEGIYPSINLGLEKLMYAYLADVKSLRLPVESFDAYLGAGAGALIDATMLSVASPNDQPLMMMRSIEGILLVAFKKVRPDIIASRVARFRAAIAIEAFDSFYCNRWSAFNQERVLAALTNDEDLAAFSAIMNKEKNTRGIMRTMFPRTHEAFKDTIDKHLQRGNFLRLRPVKTYVKAFALGDGPTPEEITAGRSIFRTTIREDMRANVMLPQVRTSLAFLQGARSMALRREAEAQAHIDQYQDYRSQALWLGQAALGRDLVGSDKRKLEILQSTLSPIPVGGREPQLPYGGSMLNQAALLRSAAANGFDPLHTTLGEPLLPGRGEPQKMYQIDLRSGKQLDPNAIAFALPSSLQGRARELVVKAQLTGNLTEAERAESHELWAATQKNANSAAQGLVNVDEAWSADLERFKANYKPLMEKATQNNIAVATNPEVQAAFLRAKFNQYYEKTDPALRDKLYPGETAEERFKGFQEDVKERRLLDGLVTSIDDAGASQYDAEIKSLYVTPASSDPDQRVLLAKGAPTRYSEPLDWSTKQVTTDSAKRLSLFSSSRYIDPVTNQKQLDKEAARAIAEPLDQLQAQLDMTTGALNLAAGASWMSGVGAPVGFICSVAACGIDIANFGATAVRAATGSEAQKEQLVWRAAAAIPGKGMFKAFDYAAETYSAVGAVRKGGNAVNLYQAGQIPVGGYQTVDHLANQEVYAALAEQQSEMAKIGATIKARYSLPEDVRKNISATETSPQTILTAGAIFEHAVGKTTEDVAKSLVSNNYVKSFLDPANQQGIDTDNPQAQEAIVKKYKVPLLADFVTDDPEYLGLATTGAAAADATVTEPVPATDSEPPTSEPPTE